MHCLKWSSAELYLRLDLVIICGACNVEQIRLGVKQNIFCNRNYDNILLSACDCLIVPYVLYLQQFWLYCSYIYVFPPSPLHGTLLSTEYVNVIMYLTTLRVPVVWRVFLWFGCAVIRSGLFYHNTLSLGNILRAQTVDPVNDKQRLSLYSISRALANAKPPLKVFDIAKDNLLMDLFLNRGHHCQTVSYPSHYFDIRSKLVVQKTLPIRRLRFPFN